MTKMVQRARNISALSGAAFAATTLMFAAPATAGSGKIVVEAEAASKVVEHFAVKTTRDKKVPSGKYLAAPPGSCGKDKKDLRGYATYPLNVKETGAYILWVRSYWEDGCGNSVWAQIDGQPSVGKDKGQTVGEDGTYNYWKWRKAKEPFRLKAGKHELRLNVREDGVRIDQVLLTKDKEYIPTREERPTK